MTEQEIARTGRAAFTAAVVAMALACAASALLQFWIVPIRAADSVDGTVWGALGSSPRLWIVLGAWAVAAALGIVGLARGLCVAGHPDGQGWGFGAVVVAVATPFMAFLALVGAAI